METYMVIIFALLVVIGIFGVVFSAKAGNHQKRKDEELGENTARHKITLNPILWSYVLVLLGVIVGAIIFYMIVYA